MPILTLLGWSLMNARAASCAAASRVGFTSTARMLPDTSIARMTTSCCDGSVTTATGRAIATIISVSPTRNSAGGTCRRTRWPRPSASRTIDRLA